ncbi:MAG: hypothetical protein ACAH80_18715 [Alphaproteobacteria bacterium]
MAKFRQATTTQAAVHAAMAILGIDRCADLLDKQASTIYAYGDLDKERHISFDDAKLLDTACKAEDAKTPFFDAYRLAIEDKQAKPLDLSTALLDIHEAAGELSAILRAAQLATSPGGAAFVAAEKLHVNAVAKAIIAEVRMILDAVNGASSEAG